MYHDEKVKPVCAAILTVAVSPNALFRLFLYSVKMDVLCTGLLVGFDFPYIRVIFQIEPEEILILPVSQWL